MSRCFVIYHAIHGKSADRLKRTEEVYADKGNIFDARISFDETTIPVARYLGSKQTKLKGQLHVRTLPHANMRVWIAKLWFAQPENHILYP